MKIGVVGCRGRVGSLLVNEIHFGGWKGIDLSGGTVLPEDMGPSDFFITANPEDLFKKSDVIIDFTSPSATRKHAKLAAKHKVALIVGTTGLSTADEKEIAEAAKKTVIVQSANFSVGVNVLLALVERGAATLGDDDFDIEIFEAHHKNKVDAPSGTALALGKAAAKGRKVDLKKSADWARHGETGKRKKGKIGFSVARGGDVVGDHRVFFYGEGERVELSHIATNRSLFARGALRAALWTKGKKPGLYSMKDILGL
jgi:4-hydroxy-tetrahydrodipicolinate reductase